MLSIFKGNYKKKDKNEKLKSCHSLSIIYDANQNSQLELKNGQGLCSRQLTVNGTTQTLASPGYPNSYSSSGSYNCTYTLTASAGQTISFYFDGASDLDSSRAALTVTNAFAAFQWMKFVFICLFEIFFTSTNLQSTFKCLTISLYVLKLYDGAGTLKNTLYSFSAGASGIVTSSSNVATVVFTSSRGAVGYWKLTYTQG